jgi:wyosine [tRNA(Phe)-imidazoG37] synthetase (radical SAM superfamily)
MKNEVQRFVFGPVPSRRLGRSLGVDLVPFKTCSYDCIYCQLGPTTNRTIVRKRYVPVFEVLDQLSHKLNEDTEPDYITFSGSGEPTLHSDLGQLIEAIKKRVTIPVAVLTNGSLLWDKQVQEGLMGADLVVPSLDAGSPRLFRQINRPDAQLEFSQVLEGLIEFRRLYTGRVWLEVFLVDGVNTAPPEIARIRECVQAICPDKVQLNTVVRPPAEGLGVHRSEALKYLTRLEEEKVLRKIRRDDSPYYQMALRTPKNCDYPRQ